MDIPRAVASLTQGTNTLFLLLGAIMVLAVYAGWAALVARVADPRPAPHSSNVSPEPPSSAGTSFILGRPSGMRSTDSW